MAHIANITIEDIAVETKQSPTGSYGIVTIKGSDKETYTGLASKFPFLPDKGSSGQLIYSRVNINGKEQRTILSFKEEYKEMAKTTNTKGTSSTTTGQSSSSSTSTGNGNTLKIKGTLFYAHVKNPETNRFNPDAPARYTLSLGVSDSLKEILEEKGVEVKDATGQNKGDIKGNYVVIRSTFQPLVTDSEGNKLTEIPLIGNGSTGIITVTLYKNKAMRGGKFCLGMSAIQLENLIEYTPPSQEVLE